MNYSKISVRYAKALFSVAKEKNITGKIKDDVAFIQELINENPELISILENPVLKSSKKKEIMISVLSGIVNEITISFLNLLFDNKRENHILAISRKYLELYKEFKNIKTVQLTTSLELDETLENKITKAISKNIDGEIELSKNVDENIIGGFVIQVEDQLLDASVSSRLRKIESEFTNGTI